MNYIKPVDEYPIPFDLDEIMEIQIDSLEGDYGLRDEDEIIEGVDAFHDRCIDEKIRTDEWSIFRCEWDHLCQYMYFWNHQAGYGFRVDTDWEFMCGFVEMMDQFTDEYDSEDFEPNMYPWQLP